jgi:TolB-like protein
MGLALAVLVLASSFLGSSAQVPSSHLAAQTPLRLAVLTFEDEAGFQGKWELGRDVPALLGKHLSREGVISIVSRDSVEMAERSEESKRLRGAYRAAHIGERVGADYVISGKIEAFGVRRIVVGDPNLVGYKSYTYHIDLRNIEMTRAGDRQIVEAFDAETDSVSRPFELNLFGRPGEQEREFRRLFTVDFDSDEFYNLAFGRFVASTLRDVSKRLVDALIERPAIVLSGEAKVLAVDDAQVFLGIGSDDLVEHGDLLPLLNDTTEVALVKIDQIIGPHLSRAAILGDATSIEIGMRIGQRISWGSGGGDIRGLDGGADSTRSVRSEAWRRN